MQGCWAFPMASPNATRVRCSVHSCSWSHGFPVRRPASPLQNRVLTSTSQHCGFRKTLTVAMARPQKQPEKPEGPEAVSHLRFTRGSTLKFRRVLDQIRGRSYPEALSLLEHMPFRACEPLKDLLIAVAADAKHNFSMTKARLFVSECYANEAGAIKRMRPRAKGRGYKIKKGVSHVTIKVREGGVLDEAAAAAPSQA